MRDVAASCIDCAMHVGRRVYTQLPPATRYIFSRGRVYITTASSSSEPQSSFSEASSPMATPGFGFSAGDFIAAATLIGKVIKALKDAGGAREEYQAFVNELGLLQQILAKLESDSEATDSGHAYYNVARQQTKVTIAELTRFLETISKFHSSMGENSKSGWHRGISRKTQWAVQYAAEVEKMRARLGTQLQLILLALSIDGQQYVYIQPAFSLPLPYPQPSFRRSSVHD